MIGRTCRKAVRCASTCRGQTPLQMPSPIPSTSFPSSNSNTQRATFPSTSSQLSLQAWLVSQPQALRLGYQMANCLVHPRLCPASSKFNCTTIHRDAHRNKAAQDERADSDAKSAKSAASNATRHSPFAGDACAVDQSASPLLGHPHNGSSSFLPASTSRCQFCRMSISGGSDIGARMLPRCLS